MFGPKAYSIPQTIPIQSLASHSLFESKIGTPFLQPFYFGSSCLCQYKRAISLQWSIGGKFWDRNQISRREGFLLYYFSSNYDKGINFKNKFKKFKFLSNFEITFFTFYLKAKNLKFQISPLPFSLLFLPPHFHTNFHQSNEIFLSMNFSIY